MQCANPSGHWYQADLIKTDFPSAIHSAGFKIVPNFFCLFPKSNEHYRNIYFTDDEAMMAE
jgi:hypothetical protein